jgi:hypothetical protein
VSAIADRPRSKPDDILQRMADKGGRRFGWHDAPRDHAPTLLAHRRHGGCLVHIEADILRCPFQYPLDSAQILFSNSRLQRSTMPDEDSQDTSSTESGAKKKASSLRSLPRCCDSAAA